MDARDLVSRLTQPGPTAPAATLAALSIDAVLATPLGELLPRDRTVAVAREALAGWLAAPGAVTALSRVVESLTERLQAEPRPMKDVVAREVRAALREVVARPFSPERRLVLAIIDRSPVRELVRQLLLDTVLDFGRKASAPVAGMARGLGSLARLAGETVKARGGGLGSLVGAVGSEVERQLERRAVDFVDAALGGVMGQLADVIANPQRAAEAAELRVAFLDGALELSGPQLARELMNLDAAGGAEVLRAGLARWVASDQAAPQLHQLADFVLTRDAGRPVGELLREIGLLEVVRAAAVEALAERTRRLAATPAFEAWLTALLAG